MVSRNHDNRSEKQKGHGHGSAGAPHGASEGHQGRETARDRSGTDERHDGKSRNAGGGDGAGGAPRTQGQGEANAGGSTPKQNRGHG